MLHVDAPLLAFLFALAGCSSGSAEHGSGPDPSDAGTDANGDAPSAQDAGPDGNNSGDANAEGSAGVVPVAIEDGVLLLQGEPTFLYGGELQYFRIRDADHDAAVTRAMWQDSIDKLKQAGMNLVTTYFPWDYHASKEGELDFTGSRDADAFLQMACDAGMKVVAKPGPLITAEWPNGFGSFGAVPSWWKEAHPDALVLDGSGKAFDFNPLPTGERSHQPSYLHPDYLAHVGDWYDAIVPILRKHIDSRCIVAVQVDNETNLYWADRFGSVDYNPVALHHYRQFLTARYGTIGALNAVYDTSYGAFDDVQAPTSLPSDPQDNVAARDWYDAGQALLLDYLELLREMLETRGIVEPDILFMTNDSPFTLVGTVATAARYILMHDGTIKNQVGLAGLDAYPKYVPDLPGSSGPLTNFPFQADYYTKLYGHFGSVYTGDSHTRYVFGAELQGGFYDFPTGIHPVVRPEATNQLLAKTVGHGMKGGSFYVARGGLNMDGSEYDFQAAIGIDGDLRPRYDVFATWGGFLGTWGGALLASEEVEDEIAILQDISYAVPQAGTNDDHQMLYAHEYAGLYGWLLNSGFNPAVLDAKLVTSLDDFDVVFFILPKMIDPGTAQLLADYHAQGGVIVQLLDPGSFDLAGRPHPSIDALSSLFPASYEGSWDWPGVPQTIHYGDVNGNLPGWGEPMRTYWYQTYWEPLPGTASTTLLSERIAITHGDGKPVALRFHDTGADRVLIGGHIGSGFNGDIYYEMDEGELQGKRELARHLAGLAGVEPAVSASGLQQLVWARRSKEGPVFLFVVNDGDTADVSIRIHDTASLGLESGVTYRVVDGLSGALLGEHTGAELGTVFLSIEMERWGATVLVLAPES